jgi:BirA family biotin operon repressor/biotin-[acetyl-CoA-carboxylase] ligase
MWVNRTESTNEEVRRQIPNIDNLSVVSASEQTDGRGQRGNSWLSAPGENLTFSIFLKFPAGGISGYPEPVHAHDQFILSEIASLSIVHLLENHGIPAQIKWPNDIYVDEKKICGMLIENSLRGEWIQHSIIGIGLNVNQENFDVNLPNPTSMGILTRKTFNLKRLLEEFMDIFTENLESLLSPTFAEVLRNRYLSKLWLKDIKAGFIDKTVDSSIRFSGIIRDITKIGHILIETEKGELKEFAFREIGYMIP